MRCLHVASNESHVLDEYRKWVKRHKVARNSLSHVADTAEQWSGVAFIGSGEIPIRMKKNGEHLASEEGAKINQVVEGRLTPFGLFCTVRQLGSQAA